MSQNPTTHEKGLALELRLAELFGKMGYNVIHDVKKTGRSGVEHQVDIFAEIKCPLHTSQIIVEAKSYDLPIDKEKIMKLIQIVDDLGSDRGIIVTTSYFTPEAIKTAKGHNVDLWNREHLVKLLGEVEISSVEKGLPIEISVKEHAVRPVLSVPDAHRIEKDALEKRRRGGFLGKGKIIENAESIVLLYLPYYEAEFQTSVPEVEKTGFMSTRTVVKIVSVRVSFDASNGDISVLDESGMVVSPYPFLKKLDGDEIRIFKSMGDGGYDFRSFAGLGFSDGKVKKILNGLVTKGALKSSRGSRGVIIYRAKTVFPSDPRQLRSISSILKTEEISRRTAEFATPRIESSDIYRRIESYWGAKVDNLSVLYYPYYICKLKTADGSSRLDTIDAMNGRLREK